MNAKAIVYTACLCTFLFGIVLGVIIYSVDAGVCEVKGNSRSKIYHTKYSQYFSGFIEDICFDSVTQAKHAGYRTSSK